MLLDLKDYTTQELANELMIRDNVVAQYWEPNKEIKVTVGRRAFVLIIMG